ncbi:MAG TPA: 30S ribosomal protein S7, partial [Anaerolineales bacterium]|nr:30S ribosomal protein S7 [Anaerolineales bacterium]
MSRRNKPEKRQVLPDPRYNSVQLQSFINRVMRNGKRSTATSLVYGAFDMIEGKGNRAALDIFDQALKNVSPMVEVKPRRVGGATYQIPMEVPPYRRFALATRWILQAARSRSGKNFSEKLAGELMDAANN